MNLWQYLLLVNVYLVLFFGFYVLLLRKETFFQLNRIYLVSAALLSFFIPLIQSDWVKNLFITQTVRYSIYSGPVMIIRYKPIADAPYTVGQMLMALYLTGVVCLIVRLVWQLISLKKIINQPEQPVSYAFFKKIKMNEDVADNNIIAVHEQVHARQWHSADVLIMEVVMIVNWFNPVVYFYRYAIKHIHEFIADNHAIKMAVSKADYAMLLLTQTFNSPSHQLVSNFFNHSLLKQRITMLQKNRSQRIALAKYGLSAPLFILMLILSSATVSNSKVVTRVNHIFKRVFELPVNTTTVSKLTSINVVVNKTNKPKTVVNKNVDRVAADLKNTEVVSTDTIKPNTSDQVYSAVQVEPKFPGGYTAFGHFLAQNIYYPDIDKQNKIEGRVIVTFIVEADGSLTNIKVLRAPSQTLSDEAVRVISLSPKWEPGVQNGKPVRVQYTVPVAFTLGNNDKKVGEINTGQNSAKPNAVALGYSKPDTIKHSGLTLSGPGHPLCLIDGKEAGEDELKRLNPNTIAKVEVLKDKSAELVYGEKGKNGVILITTKKN